MTKTMSANRPRSTAHAVRTRPTARQAGRTRHLGLTARINPRIHERKVAVAKDARKRRLMIASGILVVPGLVITAFVLLHTSMFAVHSIRISGEVNTSTQAIIEESGLSTHPPLIDVNPTAVAARIESLPWVAHAEVERNWPATVQIRIVEQMPVAEISLTAHRFELFSLGGRALAYSTRSIAHLPRIKPIPGLPSPGRRAGTQLAGEIEVAGAVPLSVVGEVRQITVTKRDGIVAILPGRVTAIFGTTVGLADKMTALSTLMANHVSLVGVSTIDLRVPSSPVLSS